MSSLMRGLLQKKILDFLRPCHPRQPLCKAVNSVRACLMSGLACTSYAINILFNQIFKTFSFGVGAQQVCILAMMGFLRRLSSVTASCSKFPDHLGAERSRLWRDSLPFPGELRLQHRNRHISYNRIFANVACSCVSSFASSTVVGAILGCLFCWFCWTVAHLAGSYQPVSR